MFTHATDPCNSSNSMAKFVDRKTAAAALGVSRQRLETLIKQGRITETPKGIELEKAKRDYEATIDPAKKAAWEARRKAAQGGRPKGSQTPRAAGPRLAVDNTAGDGETPDLFGGNFNAARARREYWTAQKAELEYKQRAGELIPRDEVRAKEFAVARKLRDRILAWPARLANWVPPEAMKIITDECDTLVRELQEDAARIAEERGV